MPSLFLCSWRMDLALNSNRAWFPGLWISTYCSHEILWVLKIMDWLSGTEILVVFICEVSKTHIIVYCYSDSLLLLIGGYKCLYVYSHVCVCVCVCVGHSVLSDSLTPHGPMKFPRQGYWSGLPCPSAGYLPHQEIKLRSLALQADSLLSEPLGNPI